MADRRGRHHNDKDTLGAGARRAFHVPAPRRRRARGGAGIKEPIKLTLHDWTGQFITTEIMGGVLQSIGYNVEYVQADYLAQFAGLEAGDLHVAMEMWETTGKDGLGFARDRQDGRPRRDRHAGQGGVVVPAYMKEQCPGLPDWQALNDCAEAFATPETLPGAATSAGR